MLLYQKLTEKKQSFENQLERSLGNLVDESKRTLERHFAVELDDYMNAEELTAGKKPRLGHSQIHSL